MPNKTIYVAEADLEVFERAQELAGNNLSATISQALRGFIKSEEAKDEGFDEITIKIGDKGTYTNKRFIGKEIARAQSINEEEDHATVRVVYETAKHRFALYTKEIYRSLNELMKIETEKKLAERLNLDWTVEVDSAIWATQNSYQLDVFDTKMDLKEHIPEELYAAINRAGEGESDTFLDI